MSKTDPMKPAGNRRSFLKKAGVGGAAIASGVIAAPFVKAQSAPIKWRLQTYSGAPLGAHVIKPQIEAFNKACLLYTSPSPRDRTRSRMPSSA